MVRHRISAFIGVLGLVVVAASGGSRAASTPTPAVDAFFDDGQVHSIYLSINSRDWQSLRDHYLDNTYYPGDFRWQNQVVRNIGIRSRGTGSRSGVKPGLRVDFDRYTTDQKFLGTLKSFILRNHTQDPSGMLEYRGSDPDLYVPHPFKPETHEFDPHPNWVAELIRVVSQDSDTIFRTTIAPLLELEKFVKHIAIENFVADQDGFNGNYGTNNFYFYRFANTHVFTFIPWDKSEAFKDGPNLSIWHNIQDGAAPEQRNRLTLRALKFQDLRSLYLRTLEDCAKSALELDEEHPDDTRGWMEREVERESKQIRQAMYEDPQKSFSNDDFEQEVENLRTFARKRPAVVQKAVAHERR